MLIPHGSQSHPAVRYLPILPSCLWMGTTFDWPFQYFPHTVCTGNTGLTEKRVEKLALTEQERWHITDNAWAF